MIRILLAALLALIMTGCVVTKETYQTQYLEARGLEATNEDLTARLKAQTAQNEELGAKLEALADELDGAKRANVHGEAALNEVRQRLERCQQTREELGTELDVSKKTVRTSEAEQEELNKRLGEELAAHKDAIKKLEGEIDERDARIEQLRTTISTLRADLDVINEQNEQLEREKREKIDEMSKTYEGLLGTMEEEIQQGRVTISKLKGQLTVNLVDEILFPSGSAEVKEEGKDVLARLGEALTGIEDKLIVIEGHTDNIPIIGGLAHRFPTNWELSTARAVSVVRYLSDTAELDPTRLSAVGFGQYHPVSENDTEEGRAKNRRIEIKLMPLEIAPAGNDGSTEEPSDVTDEVDGDAVADVAEESGADVVEGEGTAETPSENDEGDAPAEAEGSTTESSPGDESER